ncbi:MAG: MFS transporter, partial [Anaerolineae bacterium]|nr:MFS transporter [Anaerolineae bacterium]
LELTPENRTTILGFTTFVGLIVASVTQPLIGTLSDCTQSRWGRRLPYLTSGVIFLIVGLVWIAIAPTFLLFLLGVVVLQFASNTVQGPWQALLPDYVPTPQLGLASGLKFACEGLAAVAGRVVAGYLIGQVPVWGHAAVVTAVVVPASCLILGLAITAYGIRTAPFHHPIAQRSMRVALSLSFSVDLRTYPAFGWWFLNRLFFWSAMIAVGVFLLFYVMDVVGATSAEAQRFIGQATAVLGGVLLLCAVPARRFIERLPRKTMVFVAGVMAGVGTLVVLSTREYIVLMLGGALIVSGVGIYIVSSWALVTAIVPRADAARYLGIANMATALGSATARLFGGALIDIVNAINGSQSLGYLTVYTLAAMLFFLSALVVIPLQSSRPVD